MAEPHKIDEFCSRPVDQMSSKSVAIVIHSSRNSEQALRTVESVKKAFAPDVAIWSQDFDSDGCHPLRAPVPIKEAYAQIASACPEVGWILFLSAGDTVSPDLGQIISRLGAEHSASHAVYWDTDVLINGSRNAPWIKGGWDPLMFMARDSLCGACVISGEAIDAFSGNEMCDLAGVKSLCAGIATGHGATITHIPLILTHHESAIGPSTSSVAATRQQMNGKGYARLAASFQKSLFGSVTMADPQQWPSVSIIVPTRDKAHLLAACIESLGSLSYEGDVELIVVDNGSTDPEALALLSDLSVTRRATVLRDDGPFNFSRLNNRAAAIARGRLLCLLNNDVEALDGNWLAAMVRHAVLPQNGAVGALLLYPDHSVQHAGVGVGIGGAAGHIARGAKPADADHFAWHAVTRRVTAVTAACMVVRRELFSDVGALDETCFPVAFNDIDFCLKLRQRGLNNVFVSEARLLHHESKSRGSDHAPVHAKRFAGELAAFRDRWESVGFADPHYSPLFSRSAEPCLLAF